MSRIVCFTAFASIIILPTEIRSQTYDDIANVHPSWTLSAFRPADWAVQVAGMDFLPDGRILILEHANPRHAQDNTLAANGSLYVIDNPSASGEAVKYRLLISGLKEPIGVLAVNGKVYVAEKNALNEYTLDAGISKATFTRKVAAIPHDSRASVNFQEYAFGALYKDGYFYEAAGGAVRNGGKSFDSLPEMLDEEKTGCLLKIKDSDGAVEMVNGGMRAPNGLAWGPEGAVWLTDNQGSYRPASQLTEVIPGANYGYPNKANAFTSKPVTPPSLWLVHGEIAQSPTFPLLLRKGLYAGQFMMGDISLGGIKRAFVEKVNGAWQGSVFSFTGGLEVGIEKILEDSAGVLFVGGFGRGDANNWGWAGKTFGLQKLTPKPGATAFEILAIRSRRTGMELEFTKPVNADAVNAANYSVTAGTMVPQSGYGLGSMQTKANLPIQSVTISSDKRKVFLELGGLKAGTVLIVKAPGVRSETAESPRCPAGWYTLNAISQSEPFAATALSRSEARRPDLGDGLGVTLSAGVITVKIGGSGSHALFLRDIYGRIRTEKNGFGSQEYRFPESGLGTGVYWLEIRAGGSVFRKILSGLGGTRYSDRGH